MSIVEICMIITIMTHEIGFMKVIERLDCILESDLLIRGKVILIKILNTRR